MNLLLYLTYIGLTHERIDLIRHLYCIPVRTHLLPHLFRTNPGIYVHYYSTSVLVQLTVKRHPVVQYTLIYVFL